MKANQFTMLQTTVTFDGTTTTVDWTKTNNAELTMTGSITNLNFTNPDSPCHITLIIVQGGAGSYVVTNWDSDIMWSGGGTPPTLSTAVGSVDIIAFYWNGTNYFGVASLDFQ